MCFTLNLHRLIDESGIGEEGRQSSRKVNKLRIAFLRIKLKFKGIKILSKYKTNEHALKLFYLNS
jgi:hypothetical protein